MTQAGPARFDPLAAASALDTPLAAILAERIRREGPISFAEWMRACLYHPQHGYYRRGAPTVGRDGDFLTSPEVHPLFGAAVGHVIASLWRQRGASAFRVAEVGPGTGALAESILRHCHSASPDIAEALRYTLVEPEPAASSKTRERLTAVHDPDRIHAASDIQDLGQYDVIVANELLDALPVHRLVRRGGAWRELLVDHSASQGFHDCEAHVSDERLPEPMRDAAPAEGQVAEVSPERGEVVSTLCERVTDGGLLLLFDYGYERSRLYASWRRDGTLMTFRGHVPGDDPYVRPGETDITCHVDIDQVREAAQSAGLTALPTLSQAEWLHGLGAAVLPAVADAAGDTRSYLAARRAAEALTDPAGLGRIAVMAFTRGEVAPLPGWSGHA